jgi:hypothetical protein
MSLRLIRLLDRPVRLSRRSLTSLAAEALLGLGDTVDGLEFGLKLINEDARRLVGVLEVTVVVVVVVVGPWSTVGFPPLTALAFPTIFSTQASLLGVDVVPNVMARRGFVFGPAPPRGV